MADANSSGGLTEKTVAVPFFCPSVSIEGSNALLLIKRSAVCLPLRCSAYATFFLMTIAIADVIYSRSEWIL
jgi:hypothetical protein